MAEGDQQSEELSRTVEGGSDIYFELYCYPCREDNRLVEAFGFCQNCSDYLCNECYKSHCRPKVWRHHALLEIKRMPKDMAASPKVVSTDMCTSICSQHPDKFIEYNCQDHDSLMCHLCAFSNHKKCESVNHIPKVANNIDRSKIFNDTQAQLQELENVACRILETSHEYITASDESSTGAISSIKTYTQTITSIIQKHEEDLEAEVKNINSENKKMVSAASAKVKATLANITGTIQSISIQQRAKRSSDLFVSVKQAQKAIPVIARDLDRMQRNIKVDDIKFEPNLLILDKDGILGRITCSPVRKDNSETNVLKMVAVSDPATRFEVEVNQGDLATLCKIVGKKTLLVSQNELAFEDPVTRKILYTFSYNWMRRYGQTNKDRFSFECGRRCPNGPGIVGMVTSASKEIHDLIRKHEENTHTTKTPKTPDWLVQKEQPSSESQPVNRRGIGGHSMVTNKSRRHPGKQNDK